MSRLNQIIAFVATLSMPLALLGALHGPAARVDVSGIGGAKLGAPADCPDPSCDQTASIPDADSWRAAAAEGTPDAYWTYLQRNPVGDHVADAQSRLERLSVSPEPPLHFTAAEVAPPQSGAESTVGEAGAQRGPAYRFPAFLLASTPMDSAAASFTAANGSTAVPALVTPAVARAEVGGIADGMQSTPATAASGGATAPASVALPAKPPTSALSYAAAARSGPPRPSAFKPHRSSPRRFKLSELVAPRAVAPARAGKSKAVRVRRPKQASGTVVQPQKAFASAGRRAGSKPHARSMRRLARSAAPPHAGPGARSSRARQMQHARRVAPAAPWPNATLQAQDCLWPFCFGN
jgi:hypothetical protein